MLLATYNGAEFLPDLLASLDGQSDQDWELVARDDGSTDATVRLLESWGEANPGRLRIIKDGRGNLGPIGNFSVLLAESRADTFFFCDQDDVWLPKKIARLRGRMEQAEEHFGSATPLLIHSDLIVVDQALNKVSDSFWDYQWVAQPSAEAPWKMIAFQNVVTGCAMMGNAALRRMSLPVPSAAVMHDWWLALVASVAGRIIEDASPSVLYRQHGTNEVGAKRQTNFAIITRAMSGWAEGALELRAAFRRSQAQAAALLEADLRIPPDAQAFLGGYATLGTKAFLARKWFVVSRRMWFGDPLRNLALLVFI